MEESFQSLLAKLDSQDDKTQRILIYKSLIRFLRKPSVCDGLSRKDVKLFGKHLFTDFSENNSEFLNLGLNVVKLLVRGEAVLSPPLKELHASVLNKIPSLLKKLTGSAQLQLVNILSKHNVPVDTLCPHVKKIVESLQTVSIVTPAGAGEVTGLLNRFLSDFPDEMEQCMPIWLCKLLVLSSNSDVKIRKSSSKLIDDNMPGILRQRGVIIQPCASVLNKVTLPALKKLCFEKSEDSILEEVVSSQLLIYMKMIGENFKRSSSLTNSLLLFLEKGFSKDNVRLAAYRAWECFIESLGENKELISSAKYIKLLTQPLKAKVKSEKLVVAKVQTIWKLAVKLEDNLPDLFEVVCVPLLQICIGSITSPSKSSRRSSIRITQEMLQKAPCHETAVQLLGADVIGHMIMNVSKTTYSPRLTALHSPYIGSPTVFARFHTTLIPAVCDVIRHLHKHLPEDFLVALWDALLQCVEHNVSRKRETEMFRSFFQSTNQIVTSSAPSHLIMTLVSKLTKFPTKILNSSLHNVGDQTLGSVHGTPILSVLQYLFSPKVSETLVGTQEFRDIGEKVITIGMERRIGVLEFICDVIKMFLHDNETYLALWCHLADHTLSYTEESSNINQGDSLEHDFAAMFTLLVFPVDFLVSNGNAEEILLSKVFEVWQQLLSKFVHLSSLVPSTKPNEVCNKLAVLTAAKLEGSETMICEEEHVARFIGDIAMVLVSNTDFTHESPLLPIGGRKSLGNSPTRGNATSAVFELVLFLGLVGCESDETMCMVDVARHLLHIFSFLPSKLVTEYFSQSVSVLQVLMDGLASEKKEVDFEERVSEVWRKVLSRLSYSDKLFHDEAICELFTTTFDETFEQIYKISVKFWKLKVLQDFTTENVSDDFLETLESLYLQQGFKKNWGNTDDVFDLNVSNTSCQSSNSRNMDDHNLVEINESLKENDCDITNDEMDIIVQQSKEEKNSFSDEEEKKGNHSLTNEKEIDNQSLSDKEEKGNQSLSDEEEKGNLSLSDEEEKGNQSLSDEEEKGNQSFSDKEEKGNHSLIDEEEKGNHSLSDEEEKGNHSLTGEEEKEKRSLSLCSLASPDHTKVRRSARLSKRSSVLENSDPPTSKSQKLHEIKQNKANCDVTAENNEICDLTDLSEKDCEIVSDSDVTEADCDVTEADCDVTEADCDVTEADCDVTEADCDVTEADCDVTEADCDVTKDDCDVTEADCDVTEADCDVTEADCDMTNIEDSFVTSHNHSSDYESTKADHSSADSENDVINVDDVTVDDVITDDSSEFEKSKYEVVEMAEMSLAPPDFDESDISGGSGVTEGDKSVYEVVDMAEMSVGGGSVVDVSDDGGDGFDRTGGPSGVDESLYEFVEMAEISVCQKSMVVGGEEGESGEEEEEQEEEEKKKEQVEEREQEENWKNVEEEKKEQVGDYQEEQEEQDEEEQEEEENGGEEQSIYEEVGMCEMSVNQTLHEEEEDSPGDIEENEFLQKNDEQFGVNSTKKGGRSKNVDSSFESCAEELGVQPLDTSFDGKDLEFQNSDNRTISEVLEHVTPKLNLAPSTSTPVLRTPIRRSSRKRVLTPKAVVGVLENRTRFRKSCEKIFEEEDTVQDAGRISDDHKEEDVVAEDSGSKEGPPDIKSDLKIDSLEENGRTENLGVKNDKAEILGKEIALAEILGVKLSKAEILNSEIAEVENVDPKVSEAERTVDERVGNVAPTVVPDIQVESPVSKERPIEPLNESPLSCSNKRLGTILEAAITSSPGILKRKVSDTTSPAIKSRRVSFAEHSQICEVESIPRSPGASPWRRNKYANPRVVKRRLSLPATKRCRADEAPSPMSIRSATVAKAIAGIKAREAQLTSQNQLSPSTGNKGPPSVEPPSSPSQRDRASLSHLCDVTYLQEQPTDRLFELTETLLQVQLKINTILAQREKRK